MAGFVQLLGSAGAVALLVALAFAMGFRTAPWLDAARALEEADAALVGFGAEAALVSADGTAALVRGGNGARALVVRRGDRFVVRRLGAEARVTGCGDGLIVDCRETGLRRVRLALDAPPPAWTWAGHRAA